MSATEPDLIKEAKRQQALSAELKSASAAFIKQQEAKNVCDTNVEPDVSES